MNRQISLDDISLYRVDPGSVLEHLERWSTYYCQTFHCNSKYSLDFFLLLAHFSPLCLHTLQTK